MIIINIILAIIGGFFVGIERHIQNKPVGARTFALISLAGCLAVIIPKLLIDNYLILGTNSIRINLGRILAYIAGAIIFATGFIKKKSGEAIGYTTSASLLVALFTGALLGLSEYLLVIVILIANFLLLRSGKIEYIITNLIKKKIEKFKK